MLGEKVLTLLRDDAVEVTAGEAFVGVIVCAGLPVLVVDGVGIEMVGFEPMVECAVLGFPYVGTLVFRVVGRHFHVADHLADIVAETGVSGCQYPAAASLVDLSGHAEAFEHGVVGFVGCVERCFKGMRKETAGPRMMVVGGSLRLVHEVRQVVNHWEKMLIEFLVRKRNGKVEFVDQIRM